MDRKRFFYSGGNWNNSSYGLASFNGNNPRSNSNTNIGFRAALPPRQILQAHGLAFSAEVIKGSVPSVFDGRKILVVNTGVPAESVRRL